MTQAVTPVLGISNPHPTCPDMTFAHVEPAVAWVRFLLGDIEGSRFVEIVKALYADPEIVALAEKAVAFCVGQVS